ncbi:hypothetical protein OG780_01325 [Streptomyces sp. NBC_00386]|uniref:hypothetical protein n=1 Tax=Streptomyces sp. NBC_00386 TaxID=2975734 RepID=UPI002E1D06B8
MDTGSSIETENKTTESQAPEQGRCPEGGQVVSRWKGWSRRVKGDGELRVAQINRGTAWIRTLGVVVGALLTVIIGVSSSVEVNVVVNKPAISVENGTVNYSGDAYSVEVKMGDK